jgi:hypothetical protein
MTFLLNTVHVLLVGQLRRSDYTHKLSKYFPEHTFSTNLLLDNFPYQEYWSVRTGNTCQET